MRAISTPAQMAILTLALLPATVRGDTVHVIVGPGGDFVFSPADAVINVGDTVRWTWDSSNHNVGSGLPGSPTPYFFSGPPAPAGTVFDVLFDQAFLNANPVAGGVYDYHCHPHGAIFGMIGSVTVMASTPIAGDIDGDGDVDDDDRVLFVNVLLGTETDPTFMARSDLDGSGVADGIDVAPFVLAFIGP